MTDQQRDVPVAPTLGRLAQIAGARLIPARSGDEHHAVHAIGLDSQTLPPGALFAAVPGTRVHGARFAAESGAAAVLTDEEGVRIITDSGADPLPMLVVEDVRAVLGTVSAEVYGHPTRQLTVLGVTGTSGKTTTTYLLEAGLMAAGLSTGIIGTTGTRINGAEIHTELTTPEAPTLQGLFADMLAQGVSHVVMEVSSHALELGRVQGVTFGVGGFSNLSQDHLDFHPTMEDYFEAKARLFDPRSPLAAHHRVVCVDDSWGEQMAHRAGADVVRLGTKGQAGVDVAARQVSQDATGAQVVEFTDHTDSWQFKLPLPGSFNIANSALAVAMAQAAGVDVDIFIRGLSSVQVPGRMENIDEGQDFMAVVDYAHKPAAVGAVLDTLRAQTTGRVGIALGAGGDRDSSKRALMGEEAARRADLVIVTDDNPRSEVPAVIRQAVVAGAEAVDSGAEVREIASRAEAIDALVAWAQPGDAVVVTGKGHEIGQIVGDEVLHFDDREEVRRALKQRVAKETKR